MAASNLVGLFSKKFHLKLVTFLGKCGVLSLGILIGMAPPHSLMADVTNEWRMGAILHLMLHGSNPSRCPIEWDNGPSNCFKPFFPERSVPMLIFADAVAKVKVTKLFPFTLHGGEGSRIHLSDCAFFAISNNTITTIVSFQLDLPIGSADTLSLQEHHNEETGTMDSHFGLYLKNEGEEWSGEGTNALKLTGKRKNLRYMDLYDSFQISGLWSGEAVENFSSEKSAAEVGFYCEYIICDPTTHVSEGGCPDWEHLCLVDTRLKGKEMCN